MPWADAQVMARDRPAAWILDLSIGAAVPTDQVCVELRDMALVADGMAVFRLLVGLIDGIDRWTYEQGERAPSTWLLDVARGYAPDAVVYEIDAVDDGIYLCDEGIMYSRDELLASVQALAHDHADPAARAWLPGVRVTFDG